MTKYRASVYLQTDDILTLSTIIYEGTKRVLEKLDKGENFREKTQKIILIDLTVCDTEMSKWKYRYRMARFLWSLSSRCPRYTAQSL